MATFDLTLGGSAVAGRESPYKIMVKSVIYDFSKRTLAQNDVAQVLDIPADTWVSLVRWEITKVEGAARNFSIGDGVNAAGFVASTSANTLAEGVSGPISLTEGAPNTITGFSGGKYYSAADTLDVTAVTAGGLTTGILKVTAVMQLLGQ